MKTGTRLVAVALVAILLAGAVPPQLAAQEQTAQSPAQQPGMMQEQMKQQSDDSGYSTLANVYNVFYVPGKGFICGIGGLSAFLLMALTFGTAYKSATGVLEEGCGGRWTLSGEDLKPAPEEDFYRPQAVIGK